MQVDEQRLRFRDAMASLAAAVNIVTTAGHADAAVSPQQRSVPSPIRRPSVMVCINATAP